MKKSLMLVSFAFIFLLSASLVSAGLFSWINGNPPPSEPNSGGGLFGLFPPKTLPPIKPISGSPLLPPSIDEGNNGFEGGCELLEEEETFLGLEEESFINGHTIFLDEERGLLVDGIYYYPELKNGGNYLVPIPNPDCHWEASLEDDELYMLTVCPPAEEFVEEEFVE